jgi:hypothetical protein
MLLEVVLALTILVAALAAIGVQINSGISVGYENDRLTQALMLAEAKLGQLDTGTLVVENSYDAFGATFPGYFWRFDFTPHEDVPGMFLVRLEILYSFPDEILEPGDATEADLEKAEILATIHTIRPTPPTLDLQRDFGMTDEQMDEIAAKLPPEIADPTNISPAALANMDVQTLLDLMEAAPELMGLLGAGFGFTQEQLDALLKEGFDPTKIPDELPSGMTGEGAGRGGGGKGGATPQSGSPQRGAGQPGGGQPGGGARGDGLPMGGGPPRAGSKPRPGGKAGR